MLLDGACDFFDLRLFVFDFGIFNPTRNPGWVAGMRMFLGAQGVLLPRCWLDPLGRDQDATASGDGAGAALGEA